MADYEVPVEVRRMSRGERIEHYRTKVKRERLAFELLERLETSVSEIELKAKLLEVRRYRREVQETIKLMDDASFLSLTDVLKRKVRRIELVRKSRMHLLTKEWKRRSRGLANRIQALKDTEEALIDIALDVELQIVDICDKKGVDPIPYLLIHKVTGESYANFALDEEKRNCCNTSRNRGST